MAIADTITSMQENLKNAYDSVENKGVKLESKNLFDKDDTNLIQDGYLERNGSPNFDFLEDKTLILSIKQNTSYTISKISSSSFIIATFKKKPYSGMAPTNYLIKSNYTYATITSGIDDNYLAVFYYSKKYDESVSEEEIRNSIMINEGTEVLPYEPYDKPKNLSNLSSAIDSIESVDEYFSNEKFNLSTNPTTYQLITKLKNVDCSNRTYLTQSFRNMEALKEIELLNTNNITNFSYCFFSCPSLEKISLINGENCENLSSAFLGVSKLTDFPGFKDLGKAYTQPQANFANYTLSLSYSSKLTHDSLVSIINNLYDLNLTYDVANGGTLYTQSLVLGKTNLAKLTDEEKAIATMKGWVLS